MRILLPLISCFILTTDILRCQTDPSTVQRDSMALLPDTSAYIKVNINASLIMNRAFSHFSQTDITSDKFGSTEINTIGSPYQLLPGFNFGIEGLLGQSPHWKLILGISVSNTSAKYHYYKSVITRGPSVYLSAENIDNYSVYLKNTMFNYECGPKIKLFRGLFIKNTILVNQNVNRLEKRIGENVLSEWSNYPAPIENYFNVTNTQINSNKITSSSTLDFSYRLGLEYDVAIKGKQAGFFAFRNFGLTKYLPWWGLGVSYYLFE